MAKAKTQNKMKTNTGTIELKHDCSGTGVCCTEIQITLDGDVVKKVHIVRGCDGNHRGLEALVRGRKAWEVVRRLKGIDCEGRGTSCPDQLAKALEAAMRK